MHFKALSDGINVFVSVNT